MVKTKQFVISKQAVMLAYKLVKSNAGGSGVDNQTVSDFELNLKDNLYKLWNRMSSGSYFPPAVKLVEIPKKAGGKRVLGIPTVADRIAQMVVRLEFEPEVEPYFKEHSYGYRPNKSALEAVGITRQRCWKYDWVVEYDIKGLFDNIDHNLLLKAVDKHTENKWVRLYIRRWLQAPMQMPDGSVKARAKGIPQGGVISPILSNLFLHYVFDVWISDNYPRIPWCRYADDGLLHCRTLKEAEDMLAAITKRFKECSLELHTEKTKIIYCKDGKRKGEYPNTSFNFLGYCFRQRVSKNSKSNSVFINFTPAVGKEAINTMRARIRKSNVRNRTDLNLQQIAKYYNPILSGWTEYFGRYCKSGMYPVYRHFNNAIKSWLMRKYKRFNRRKTRAGEFLGKIAKENPGLFVHWKRGMVGSFS